MGSVQTSKELFWQILSGRKLGNALFQWTRLWLPSNSGRGGGGGWWRWASEGQHQQFLEVTLINQLVLNYIPPPGGKVYRLQTNDWKWIQETEENLEAGGHCTLNQDALLFTSGHQYNITNGNWSKVMEHSNEQGWENLKPGGSTAASLHSWLPRWSRGAPWSRS